MSVCKICLRNDSKNDIFQLEYDDHSGDYIFLFCLGIQVTQDLENSTKLCEKCSMKLVEFYQFKSLAIKNEAFLSSLGFQKYLENNVKSEILSQGSDDDLYDEPLIDASVLQEEPIEGILTNIRKAGEPTDAVLEIQIEAPEEVKQELSDNEPLSKKKKGSNKIEVFSCDVCGRSLRSSHALKKHKLTHPPIVRKSLLECAHCGKMMKKKHSLELHIILQHPEEVSVAVMANTRKYQCVMCSKSYYHPNHLVHHIDSIHMEKKQCLLCEKYFTGRYYLMHMKRKHGLKTTQQAEYKCDTCGKSFAAKRNLQIHLSVHTGDKPFVCDICDAKFRLKYSLYSHKAQVHDKAKDHACHICSKRYFTASLLRRHIRGHYKSEKTDNVDNDRARTVKRVNVKKVECPDCGKPLSNAGSLKVHRALHKGEKCICNVCGLAFATRRYVLHHMKTHNQIRKFACKYCPATFVRSAGRRRHELEIHLGGKKPPRKDTRRNRKRKKKITRVPNANDKHVTNPPTVVVTVPGAPGQSAYDDTIPIFPISGLFKTEEKIGYE